MEQNSIDYNSEEYKEFITKQLEQLKTDHKVDLSEYAYIFNDQNPTKQTEAKHEIYINITANILSSNGENEILSESIGLLNNNYYIPIPSGGDYQQYLKGFLSFMEDCLSSSSKQINSNG